MPEWTLILALALASSSLVVACSLAWFVLARTLPEQLVRDCRRAVDSANSTVGRVDTIEMRQAAWKNELDSYFDQIDDTLQRTEQKRKRAASAEARAHPANGGNAAPQSIADLSRDEQVARGRRMVFGG